MRKLRFNGMIAAAIGLIGFLTPSAWAADANGPAPNAIKMTKFIIGVANLDKSVAFYHALGLELRGSAELKAPAALSEMLLKLVDAPPGAMFHNAMMNIPGAEFPLEITDFSHMELHPARLRIQDPGASLLTLMVRDVDAALAVAKKAGAGVVTLGGQPVPLDKNRNVIVTDPDGYFVELEQRPTVANAVPGNIVGAGFGSFVESASQTAKFYQDKFGFQVNEITPGADPNVLKLVGLTKGEMHIASVMLPGSTVHRALFELRGVDRKPYRLRIQDPGAPAMGLEVHDMDTAIAAMKSAGGSGVTQGGSVKLGNGAVGFVRDPSGFLVELAQPASK